MSYSRRYPLHNACEIKDFEKVKALIYNGMDVNGSDEDGSTPLHEAAYSASEEIVTFLLAQKANVNKQALVNLLIASLITYYRMVGHHCTMLCY
jgi:ankyrin repeat protein